MTEPTLNDTARVKFGVKSEYGITYRFNNGYLTAQKPETAAEWVNKALAMSPDLFESTRKQLAEHQSTLATLKSAAVTKDWPKQAEYDNCQEKLRGIEARLVTKVQDTRPVPAVDEPSVKLPEKERRLEI